MFSFFFLVYNGTMNCIFCKRELKREGNSFRCENGHCFDIAKQGYVNMSRKQKDTGDNKEMVRARTNFLEQGLYDFMRQKICSLIRLYHPHVLVDIGCGQGYYTQAFEVPEKYGVDLSKEAILHAAKTDKSTLYIVSTIYDLPFADDSVDMVTSIFTPLPVKEISRILKEDGVLIIVSPAEYHLVELKKQLYDKVYLNEEKREELEGFVLVHDEVITDKRKVDDVWDLFEMTPYRYRSPKEGIEKIRNLDELDITFSFLIQVYRKKQI